MLNSKPNRKVAVDTFIAALICAASPFTPTRADTKQGGSGDFEPGSIHRAPIVIKGHQIRIATGHRLEQYRLVKTSADGQAVPIPFQIDEVDRRGDFILDQGASPNTAGSDNVFSGPDELSFMGDDVGPRRPPTTWKRVPRPSALYEVGQLYRGKRTHGADAGAVYLAVYDKDPPPPSPARYVIFNYAQASVATSRYRYHFDRKNALVVRGVDMIPRTQPTSSPGLPLVDSSTFYLKADLKYFLTFEANHRSIDSRLEAYKTGPIRTIVRVGFFYSILRLKFEIGMYTEVSFFANAVTLPALLYNPLDGKQVLRRGSGFYYGFALRDDPSNLRLQTNMPRYSPKTAHRRERSPESLYWLALSRPDRLLYVELKPSQQMLARGTVPRLYTRAEPGSVVSKTDNNTPQPLPKAPVNLALHLDMTRLAEGDHFVDFRLFFENAYRSQELDDLRTLRRWLTTARRVF